jgi:hypothetical protein
MDPRVNPGDDDEVIAIDRMPRYAARRWGAPGRANTGTF